MFDSANPDFYIAHVDILRALVQGRELLYLSWFYHNEAYNPAITQADINEFVNHYSAPGGMRAGFEYYRAFSTGCNCMLSNLVLTNPAKNPNPKPH